MALADVRAGQPTGAERIRSVVSAAGSLSLTTGGRCYDLVTMHTMDDKGRVRLHVPADSPLAAEAVCAPRGVLAGLMEFTDIAPTALRDRVRARVTLSGRLTPADIQYSPDVLVLRLDAVRATVETGGVTEAVDLDQLVLAEADPLASEEAALLGHLDHHHREIVDQLSRLVAPQVLQDAVQVRPLALDRYGITLRCEYARGHHDARIPFLAPVNDPARIGRQMERLLAVEPRACPHPRGAGRS